MVYSWLHLSNPYFWLFWSGLFLGAAINRSSRRGPRTDRWVRVSLYLTIVVVCLTLAVIASRFVRGGAASDAGLSVSQLASASIPAATLTPTLWVFAIAASGIGFLTSRYRLAAGIPVLVALVLLVVGSGQSLRGARPLLGGEGEAGVFRALSLHGGTMEVEIDPSAAGEAGRVRGRAEPRPGPAALEPSYATMRAFAVSPIVEFLAVPRWLFFLSSSLFYRLSGIAEYDASLQSTHKDFRIASEGRQGQALLFRLLGGRVSRGLSTPFTPALLQSYRVVVFQDLTVDAIPVFAERE